MQERSEAEQAIAGQDVRVYRAGLMQVRSDAGQVGCSTGWLHIRLDAGQVKCRTEQMQDLINQRLD